MRLSSRDVTIVPVMAAVAAVCHIAIGPTINMSFHIPGPTLAGPVIMAPIMVAGAVTQKRGTLLLTSALNGLILSFFVPIGFLAFPIFIVVGLVLELFCVKSLSKLASPSFSFLAGGVGNSIAVLLIATIGMGMLMGKGIRAIGIGVSMQPNVLLAIVTVVGFIAGGIGGLIGCVVMLRVRRMHLAKIR